MQSKLVGAEYLPANYKFELEKTIRQIERRGCKRIGLQFPEGIIHLSTIISDIIRCNTEVESVCILSDVVYGACCLDDISGYLIDCDLIVHYGHSCLFEIPKCLVKVIYVFVEVVIDIDHCIAMAKKYIDCTNLSILGTIQYNGSIKKVQVALEEENRRLIEDKGSSGVGREENRKETGPIIPRVFPLSSGEVLGCTSPKIKTENVLFLAEGRFHLESAMIQNPTRRYFRYCPSTKTLQRERHNYNGFITIRQNKQKHFLSSKRIIVLFGTLGRQGGKLLLKRVTDSLEKKRLSYTVVYLSELDEEFMNTIDTETGVIEIACPRIAIDWGSTFIHPIITPFEYFSLEKGIVPGEYPMDYYAKEGSPEPWQMKSE
ncbi:2-(3-amino-3-carboxypropyl)histidine synthase [Nematocida sp. AWRm80]|nr:2-(3-amino-3-carboxypropyl)histidine synthase [Nematocida sp. AWRm80]